MNKTTLLMACAVCAGISFVGTSFAQQPVTRGPVSGSQVVPLDAASLYQGWRASQILGDRVVNKINEELGTVRNILVGADGEIEALIVQNAGSPSFPEFVYRIPWRRVEANQIPNKVIADISPGAQKEYGVSLGDDGSTALPAEFAVTKVFGDYARLQQGFAYGFVSEVVFSEGRMLAVLVIRDALAGGGIYAFGFPDETTVRWSPTLGYYGLPYVTVEKANAAAIRVDPKRFVAATVGAGR